VSRYRRDRAFSLRRAGVFSRACRGCATTGLPRTAEWRVVYLMNSFELTKTLMSIPSVTGTERNIGEFLSTHLTSLGYHVERQDVRGDRFNVFAFSGSARVMFCTHIDT